MLYLTRKLDESVIINDEIEVKVIDIKGKTVKLGFEFPKSATVLRKEIYDKVVEQNKEAAGGNILGASESAEDFFSSLLKDHDQSKNE
jgi:carbon storage regulator